MACWVAACILDCFFTILPVVINETKDGGESEDGEKEMKPLTTVSLYVTENMVTFINFFQQLGLLWALSFLVDWPPLFLLSTWFEHCALPKYPYIQCCILRETRTLISYVCLWEINV